MKPYVYPIAVVEAALHHLAPLDQQVGAPWPHQQREFLQALIQILEETRVKLLDSEHYPSCEQFTNDCCADTSTFLEMVKTWSCDWRVAFGAAYLAVAGLYAHPNLGTVKVAGVPVKGLVREILDFISEKGLAFGKLEAVDTAFTSAGRGQAPQQGPLAGQAEYQPALPYHLGVLL